jgi:hypothetical protein
MPSPFPGMNPYLEHPSLWPEIHNRLIVAISDSLVPQLVPQYIVAIEHRIYQILNEESLLIGMPDLLVKKRNYSSQIPDSETNSGVAVMAQAATPQLVRMPMPMETKEAYLEVRDTSTGEVITVIELLSPKNKRKGPGRQAYEDKRYQILSSRTNLVEIDLLRSGEPLLTFGGEDIVSDYRLIVSRGWQRPVGELYAFNLEDNMPIFPLPLRREEPEILVNLQELLGIVYERAGLDYRIDYQQEVVPSLSELQASWVEDLLREKGVRNG